jgi:hypothetical protein
MSPKPPPPQGANTETKGPSEMIIS